MSTYPDQTKQMYRMIWLYTGWIWHKIISIWIGLFADYLRKETEQLKKSSLDLHLQLYQIYFIKSYQTYVGIIWCKKYKQTLHQELSNLWRIYLVHMHFIFLKVISMNSNNVRSLCISSCETGKRWKISHKHQPINGKKHARKLKSYQSTKLICKQRLQQLHHSILLFTCFA